MKILHHACSLKILGLFLVSLAGCSPSGPTLIEVHGKVTWEGQPVGKGEVTFVPSGEGQPAVGAIQPDGSFELHSHGGRVGAEPGEYRVAIRSYEGSFMDNTVRYLIPEEFSQSEASGLTANVSADSAATVVFDFHLP